MGREVSPEELLKSLDEGKLGPVYLFYGEGEFWLERVLESVRRRLISPSTRDFNLEVFYGGEKIPPAEIIHRAYSLPFLSGKRLIIVRRTEDFSAGELESFLPYLQRPAETTCLIFVASKTDFRKGFYKQIKEMGGAIHFTRLRDGQVVPWIIRMAKEVGLEINGQAAAYLQQMVGNRARDLYGELEKLHLRYGKGPVGLTHVQELATHSRVYTIFELMKAVSERRCAESLAVLSRFLEEEDKRQAPLRILGMLNRQVRIIWQTKWLLSRGRQAKEVAKRLGLREFAARDFMKYAQKWTVDDLQRAIQGLYRADALLKTGTRAKPILEDLVLSLCL